MLATFLLKDYEPNVWLTIQQVTVNTNGRWLNFTFNGSSVNKSNIYAYTHRVSWIDTVSVA